MVAKSSVGKANSYCCVEITAYCAVVSPLEKSRAKIVNGIYFFRSIEKSFSMTAMILLAFVLGYPLIMVFGYFLAKVLFTPLDKIEQEQKQEKVLLMQRARRVKKKRVTKRVVSGDRKPTVFGLPELNPSHS